jgi:hypothetical protein
MRTDKKPKPIPKHTERQKSHEIGFGFDNQMEMFLTLWDNSKDNQARVICPYTGEILNFYHNTNMFWSCFAHILPKGRYPYFKLNPDNIRIVHPSFHNFTHNGIFTGRKLHPTWKWDIWDSEVIALKEKYAKFKKENLLA